ncbi:MAG: 2-C-methyl-D-erythritol 4-phosphate cytidylyltransferase [bacterium]
MNSAIIVAAGKSERMGVGTDKAFLSLGSRPVLAWSLLAFEQCHDIDQIVLVVRKEQIMATRGAVQMFGISKLRTIVAGGQRRQDSVANGLVALDPDTRIVAVHDGARPCITADLISETIRSAKRTGSGVAASRVIDTIKFVERGAIVDHTLDRDKLWAVQTPQTFKVELLRKAYAKVAEKGVTVTDEAAAMELLGEPVRLVEWPRSNPKITTAEDLTVAAALLKIQGS